MTQQTKKIKRKEQIQQVAQNLFREKGYSATSMRDIANQIGIEAASLYNHINSKEHILQKICFDIADQFFQAINTATTAQSNLNPKQQLEEAIRQHIFVITNNLDAAAVFLHEWRYMSESHLKRFKTLRNQYEQAFRTIIQKGKQQGYFHQNIDDKFYCLTLFSALNWTYDWYKPDGKLSPTQVADQLSSLLLNGIVINHHHSTNNHKT